jgi:hypothetical protein
MSYSDCFEVLKTADGYYYRSIPRLTRPILTHGSSDESPLQFTETERQRQEWQGEVRQENLEGASPRPRTSRPVDQAPAADPQKK